MKPIEIKEITRNLPKKFQNCLTLLESCRKNEYFTAWSFGNHEYFISSFWADEAFPVGQKNKFKKKFDYGFHPHFDLASLTKPLFVNAWLRYKWDDKFFQLIHKPLSQFSWKHSNSAFSDFINQNTQLTFDTFLSHKSYFKPWIWVRSLLSIKKSSNIKNEFLELLLKNYSTSFDQTYSDLNYMFLMFLFEFLWSKIKWDHEIENLNSFLKTEFFHAGVHPEYSQFAIPSFPYFVQHASQGSKKKYFGPVHDTNANILATLPFEKKIITGHAGLYGNILDVFLGIKFLQKTQPKQKNLGDQFICGLQNLNNKLGHLGYTGTSFSFDPNDLNCHYILLTNRTSHRTQSNSYFVPRIYVFTHLKTGKTEYFLSLKEKIKQLSEEEVLKNIDELHALNHKSWNDSKIPHYQNLSEVRKKIETEIW